MKRHPTLTASLLATAVLLAAAAVPAVAAPGDQPVKPVPAAKPGDNKAKGRTASIPAKGLFKGDQLTDEAKSKLTDLIIEALGLRVEVALVIPTGPWQIDGSGAGERDLTPARLNAVRKFLTERGIESQRIFVESRVDAKIKEPRLDVQLLGQTAND
jgi:OmpA-OmpF porin, OOP family